MYSNNVFVISPCIYFVIANFPGTDLSVDDHNNYLGGVGGGLRSAPFKLKKTKLNYSYNYTYIVKS